MSTAERLFRTQGYAATGLAQIIAESGSPKGSFYFHFPGGKDQLAAEVAQRFAAQGLSAIRRVAAATPGDAAGFATMLCSVFAAEMRESRYALGCALQNIAVERAPNDAAMTPLLKEGLDSWVAAIAEHFSTCGVSNSESIAQALVAALEGARTLAKVQSSDTVFSAIADIFAIRVAKLA